MDKVIETLEKVVRAVGDEWKNDVLIDNDTDNPYVDTYNDGVRAMANKVCYRIYMMLEGISSEKILKGDKQ